MADTKKKQKKRPSKRRVKKSSTSPVTINIGSTNQGGSEFLRHELMPMTATQAMHHMPDIGPRPFTMQPLTPQHIHVPEPHHPPPPPPTPATTGVPDDAGFNADRHNTGSYANFYGPALSTVMNQFHVNDRTQTWVRNAARFVSDWRDDRQRDFMNRSNLDRNADSDTASLVSQTTVSMPARVFDDSHHRWLPLSKHQRIR